MTVIFWVIVSILLAVLMIVAGVQHLWNPNFYLPFVPPFMPFPMAMVYLSGLVELLLGLAILFLNHKYTKFGMLGVFVLMVIYLPLHIADAFSMEPIIGSPTLAYIRLAIQLLLIWLSWNAYQFSSILKNHYKENA